MAMNGIIIAVVEMVLVFGLENKRPPLIYVSWGALLMALSFIVFNILPGMGSLAVISTLIVTFGEMIGMPFMNTYWIGRSTAQNRGQYAGLYTMAWSVAHVVGPWVAALVAERAGFTALWWCVGGLSVVAALGYRYLHSLR
jgi:predicted MFS family arabinose efflux permease